MASKVTYALFAFVFLAIIGGEVILNGNDVIPPLSSGNAGGLITANVTSGVPTLDTVPAIIIIAFISLSVLLLYRSRGKEWTLFESKSHAYASVVLRIVLGVFLIVSGMDTMPTWQGYALGIAKMALGAVLIIGIFVRPAAYLAFFYLLSRFFGDNPEYVITFLLMMAALTVFLLGGKEYSLDERKSGFMKATFMKATKAKH